MVDCFNPRARTGRDVWYPHYTGSACRFNPRARTGRDRMHRRKAYRIYGFNPRARTGRDWGCRCIPAGSGCFNPRARTGRDSCDASDYADYGFQSTRPHGARQSFKPFCSWGLVSIHAPARGATRYEAVVASLEWFQSTRPHGARPPAVGLTVIVIGFNPRARTGRDETERLEYLQLKVSIHAPARGATAWRDQDLNFEFVSIHAPARGATIYHRNCNYFKMFQSTRPHGARLETGTPSDSASCFNPRARTGRDWVWISILCMAKVSIHAPARGATTESPEYIGKNNGFNPRARTGRDATPQRPLTSLFRFNPRARTGRDGGDDESIACDWVSIHAPARGATLE